jgi:hypothetical protein
MAGIDDDRQVTQALHGWNNAEIQRIPRMVGEGPHASLAKNHVVIPFAHHVLGSHQELFERGRHSTLDHYWLAGAPSALQQREILHVACTDLDHVGILLHEFERFVINRFGHDLEAVAVANVRHDAQGFFAEALK